MYRYLPRLCMCYIQDWDLIYAAPTDPIDQFCSQNDARTQVDVLREMEDFYQRAQAGEESPTNLVRMGLGHFPPGSDPKSLDWFRDAIEYLRARTQGAPAVDAAGVTGKRPRSKKL